MLGCMDKILRINTEETIFYREFGKGIPLVLVPSLWVTSTSYIALGKELGKHFRVLIPDIYCGKSIFPKEVKSIDAYVDKLEEFIRGLRLTQYFLIGVSLSGIAAIKYVLRYKNRPKKMFLISTTLLPLNIKRQRLTLFWGYLMILYHNMFSREGIAINWLWITDGMDNARWHFRQAWTEGLIATSLEIENIKMVPVSTKLVFALRDEFIPREAVARLSKVKNLELEVLDRFHGWFFRHEKELVDKIVHFFNRNSERVS